MRDCNTISGQALFIAQSRRTRLHSVIWVIKKGRWDVPTVAVTPELYNGLMGAKNVGQLLDGMEPLGPLTHENHFGSAEDYSNHSERKRCFTVAEAIELLGTGYDAVNEEMLYRETFLYPFAREYEDSDNKGKLRRFIPEGNKSATKKAAKQFGAVENSLLLQLERLSNSEEYVVCIEPLQEWLQVRNSLSICSSLYAASLDIEKKKGPLSSFAFHPEGSIFKCACYSTKYGFNPFWRNDSTLELIKDSFFKDNAKYVNPLNTVITSELFDKKELVGFFSLQYFTVLNGHNDILFLSAPQVDGSGVGFKKIDNVDDLETYLVLVDKNNEGPQAVASKAFKAFEEVLFRGEGGLFNGYLYGSSGIGGREEESGDSLLGYGSLIAALWGTMLHHRGYKLVTCDRCGNTVLASNKGVKTRFCSSSCRSAASKEAREKEKSTAATKQ